ncbi:uncharacterized protein VP01_2388g1 [Puccinia sorghi]|uniref:ATP-dependent DNA helicase n=1 Tax=Puccinia sorghi TaxID=27349 RepID=A0A0L6V6X2_9BASI|nr:uncharacterized protein VP01_2388g1 [Puccinia sorghi]
MLKLACYPDFDAPLWRHSTKYQLRECSVEVLIIDEITMVLTEYVRKIERVAQALRNCEKPMGGIRLILCGEFLQIPPVSRERGKFKGFPVMG